MDPVFFASVLSYRVVCSWEPDCPKRIYVDICRDGFCSHDLLFEMQKKFYNNDKLERIFNDSRGIFIKETRDGSSVNLIYIKHRDPMAQKRQKELRALVDGEIMRVFRRMKEEGKLQTISVQTQFDWVPTTSEPKSLFEEKAKEEKSRAERLKKLKKIRSEYYASRKYANAPHIRLMMAQKERSGD